MDNWLTKFIANTGSGIFNQLPMLVRNVPQLATQMMPAETPPIVGHILSGIISQVWGGLLDKATGTSDSDIRASDFLGNYTTRDILLSREGRRVTRNLGGESSFAAAYLEEVSRKQTEAIAAHIYEGTDAAKRADSLGYKTIQSMIKNARKASRDLAIDLVADARFNGISIGGVDFRKPVEISEAELNGLDDETKAARLTAVETARKEQIAQAEWLTKVIDRVYSGGELDGKAVSHVSGSLTKNELAQVLSDFAQRGGFEGSDRKVVESELRNYVQKIALGVDNVKQVLGANTTADQAMSWISRLYGFNVARDNPQMFSAITANMRDIMISTGMDGSDIYGDQKAGKLGYISIMQSALKDLGINKHAVATMGLMLGKLRHGQSSGIYGMSDDEYTALTARRLRTEEFEGINTDSAIALLHWANKNKKKVTNLSDEDRQAFLQDIKAHGVDLTDTTSVRRYVGPEMFAAYRLGDSHKQAFDANSSLFSQLSAQRAAKIYTKAREKLKSLIGEENHEKLRAKLGGKDVFKQPAVDVETAIQDSELDDSTKAQTLMNYRHVVDWLRIQHSLGAQERTENSVSAVRGRIATNFNQSDPTQAVIQYINQQNANQQSTSLSGFVSAALGIPVADDSVALKKFKEWGKSQGEDGEKLVKTVVDTFTNKGDKLPEQEKGASASDKTTTANKPSSLSEETKKPTTDAETPSVKTNENSAGTAYTEEISKLCGTMDKLITTITKLVVVIQQRHGAIPGGDTQDGGK